MKTLGHPIIWSGDLPDWITRGNFPRDELITIMVNHIKTLMSRYKGRMNAWVVVNEAYTQPGGIFYKTIGPDYVEIAFQAARDADPSAVLIYNDYDNERASGQLTQHTREIIQRLKAKNLIDAVGLEMHISGANPPDKQDVLATMRSYGLPVYVTEFDVHMDGVPGTTEHRYALQAEIYKSMLSACVESGVCKDFVFFGIVDKFSVWEVLPQLAAYSHNADPTPFDDNFQPKPAYFAMRDALMGK